MATGTIEKKIEVLLIEDDAGSAFLVADTLNEMGQGRIRLEHVLSRNQGEQRLRETRFDVVLLDLGLPESIGVATLRYMRELFTDQAFIVLSGLNDADAAREAISLGARDYLVKGEFKDEQLLHAILMV